MIICDTGPLVAAGDRDDDHNRACTDLFTGLHLARRQILVAGPAVEASFLQSIVNGTLTVVDLQLADYARMADLVQTYADFPLGTTDASVIAVAERLGATEIATLDHRHFRAVRPRHVTSFALLP